MAGRDGEIVINLRRNNLNTPWGFRLQGGKEYGTYLSVQRVFNGSPSDGHLQRGDIIVAVNNEDVTQWHQNEAQNLIQSIGLTLGLVVMRGGAVPYAEARQTSQSQSVPSFARKPFGQQQQQQYASHPPPPQHQPPSPLSPQMTSKATLQFQPSPYSPSQPSNEFENIRPSPTVTWTPQAPASSSFSAPLQVRIGQPPAKPYSFSPQQGDSRAYQPQSGVGQANYQQDYVGGGGGGYAPYGREAHPQREAAQSTQQPSYGGGGDSNHVTHDRNQSHEGFGHDDRNEQAFYEGRREGGGGGGGGGEGGAGEEDEDYQQMTVRDIKQMFNKPDQKGSTAVSRVKQPQRLWTRPAAEGSLSPGAYGAPGPMPHQPSSLSPRKPMTGSIQRGPPPSDDDYRKQPLSPQAHHQSYGHQPRYDAAGAGHAGGKQQKSSLAINKQGGAYGGIIQPALPAKTPPAKSSQKGAQQKKEFDPNQSAVYKILLEEEERKKNNPNQKDEEEEEGEAPRRGPAARQGGGGGQQGPRRQTQASKPPPPPAQGSRLTELLERDAAQIAPYKEKPKSAYEEHVAAPYHHEQQRPTYQEPPRPSYHQEPPQQPHRGPPGPPSHGAPVARQSQPSHYGGGGGSGGAYDYHQNAFPQTQYVDGIPTSDF